MKVEAKAYKLQEKKNSLVGFGSIVIDDEFTVKDIAIMEGSNGLFITFPSKKDAKAENGYSNVAYPITKESRELITEKVLLAYRSLI